MCLAIGIALSCNALFYTGRCIRRGSGVRAVPQTVVRDRAGHDRKFKVLELLEFCMNPRLDRPVGACILCQIITM